MSVYREMRFRLWCYAAVCLVFLVILSDSALAAWTGVGPSWKEIRDVSVAPDNPLVRYAGAFGTGMYKSVDGGSSWSLYNAGLTNTYVRAVLAVSSAEVFVGTNDGVFHRTGAGVNWSMVLPTAASVRSLARDPVTGRLYAGTFGDDLYVSATGGSSGSWTKSIVQDDTSGVVLSHIRSVAVFGQDSVYVGGSIGDVSTGGALFASYNGGTSWIQVQRGVGIRNTVMDIAISPNNPDSSLIIGTTSRGVYKSTAGGVVGSWQSINGELTLNPLTDTNTSCVLFTSGYRMVGTDLSGGFYRRMLGDSTNGLGWAPAIGLPGMPAFLNSAWSNATGSDIMIGTEGQGVYQSLDTGKTFAPRNTGMMGTSIRDIVFGNSNRLIVATGFGDKIWYSDNAGTSWIQAQVPTSNSVVDVDRANGTATLYAGVYATGVLKSVDNGQTWTVTDSTVINRFVRSVAVSPGSSAIAYAGTGNGVFKTADGGLSWVDANAATIPFSTSVRSLAVSPHAVGTVLAGTDVDHLYRSTNSGGNWTHIASGNGFSGSDAFIRCLEFHPTATGLVYAGSDSGHVYTSLDYGATWMLLASLPTVNSVRTIQVDPAAGSRLFAATFGAGGFVSENGGTDWTNISAGLPDSELNVLELDPAGPSAGVYLGTHQTGLFKGPYSTGVCTCPCATDPQCDGIFSNVQDVVVTVNVAFRGSAPVFDAGCPNERTDVDASGFTNVTDVVRVVNVAFRGASVTSQYVSPCP